MSGKQAVLLRIYIGESDHIKGHPAYKEIVHFLKQNNVAGATVLRGIYGYGKRSQLHSASVLRLSTDLPVLIEVVDSDDKIQSVLPEIKTMVKDGLITLENITVVENDN